MADVKQCNENIIILSCPVCGCLELLRLNHCYKYSSKKTGDSEIFTVIQLNINLTYVFDENFGILGVTYR